MIALLLVGFVKAQTTSTFEENVLPDSSYYDGADGVGGFTSGNAYFENYFDFGFWLGGWAYSNITDTVTQPSDFMTQLYSVRETSGYSASENFAIGTDGAIVKLTGVAAGKSVAGFYITNSTYAYNSMKLGDGFAKKFGGASGNDPDYFKLVIKKYQGGTLATDSVEFFLADYRFADNTQDYIVKEWTWVDLGALGDVDSLVFSLSSTDNGAFGMNTPAYFCIDNLVTNNSPSGFAELSGPKDVHIFPNPCVNTLNIAFDHLLSTYSITGMDGKLLMNGHASGNISLDVSTLPAGVYVLEVNGKKTKFVKQ